ncbi:dicarboxylate/amino acid:cation symporter [Thermosediminibacter oceani]|uniref:Sodium:dicarboxylate symporter n=1 Tax=Thermosediminibacter oceani (strain ATCC BAA-1034 / DSM 16646 / JW/IW-1228P) TaxID=555079 RepID=D9S0I6_THEOJ|nr:dicarboxylate/amino acid:cation symporter [Thermosediminibacter oceani]ADL08844.1 sodium:dicarboxylate symporter [Thermosediminibacter oceani DSM 16646]
MNESKKQSVWGSYKFPIILMSAIIIGSLLGIILGNKAQVLKPFGDIFLNAMFTIVVPLVFITISSAVASIASLQRLGKILSTLLVVFILTGMIASLIMIITVNIFPPAQGVKIELPQAEELKPLNTADQIVAAITVTDFPDLISRKNMLPLIIFSIFFGLAISMLGEKARLVVDGLNILSEAMIKMVSIIMYYAPIGLGAYFASLVGSFGPQLLGSYARAMVIYYPITIIYFFVGFAVYAYFAGGKKGVKTFFKEIISPAVTSLATQSSIATLPVNLEAAKRIGIPKDIREIVLPIGATAHMDGSCLSAILKISFLFGLFGIPFTGIGTYISAAIIAVLSGVVMSGVPGGGLIGEMLIVSMYGFPPEAFPIIATIGYLVDPPATMVNSTGDTVAAMIITRILEGKDWMDRNLG